MINGTKITTLYGKMLVKYYEVFLTTKHVTEFKEEKNHYTVLLWQREERYVKSDIEIYFFNKFFTKKNINYKNVKIIFHSIEEISEARCLSGLTIDTFNKFFNREPRIIKHSLIERR